MPRIYEAFLFSIFTLTGDNIIKIQRQITQKESKTMNTRSNLFTNERVADKANFSAPLGAAKKGRLEITSSISNLDLVGDATIENLFEGQVSGHGW